VSFIIAAALAIAEKLFAFAAQRVDANVETARIKSGVEIEKLRNDAQLAGYQADLIKTGMQTRVFWVAWALAALPMAAWFGWGMLDTLFNGALPDVASIPAGLKFYADAVWQNIFYTGALAATGQSIATTVGKALTRKR